MSAVNDMVAATLPTIQTVPKGLVEGTQFSLGNLLQVLFGGGTIVALLRLGVVYKRNEDSTQLAKRKADIEEDASLRADFMKLLNTQQERITELEKGIVEERTRCAAEMHAMQTRHDQAIAEIRGELRAATRTVVQKADSAGFVALHTRPESEE